MVEKVTFSPIDIKLVEADGTIVAASAKKSNKDIKQPSDNKIKSNTRKRSSKKGDIKA